MVPFCTASCCGLDPITNNIQILCILTVSSVNVHLAPSMQENHDAVYQLLAVVTGKWDMVKLLYGNKGTMKVSDSSGILQQCRIELLQFMILCSDHSLAA